MVETKYYLTISKKKVDGVYIAIISTGQPQLGDRNVTVLDAEKFRKRRHAHRWFEEQLETRPWESRQ